MDKLFHTSGMAFVPGFKYDVFVSYAHEDDRDWIKGFFERLKPELSRRLPGASVWIDEDNLRKSSDFRQEIPENLESSAGARHKSEPATALLFWWH